MAVNSIVVWVLVIHIPFNYVVIQFDTEQQCEHARATLTKRLQDLSVCEPSKKAPALRVKG